MSFDLMQTQFPLLRIPNLWDDEDWHIAHTQAGNSIAISEDDTHVYIEAAVPGIDAKDVEVTFDKGVIWIKGESKTSQEKRKYYQKRTESFSYRITVPGDIDMQVEPQAQCKNGIMHITFMKSPASQPKKILVKA